MVTRLAQCSCGQLTARCTGEPTRVSVCHCHACQRRTGSAYGALARFPADAVAISGAATEYARFGDSGTRAVFYFCSSCGTTVYWKSDGFDQIAISLGAFADDEQPLPPPMISMYDERGHAWAALPPDIERG